MGLRKLVICFCNRSFILFSTNSKVWTDIRVYSKNLSGNLSSPYKWWNSPNISGCLLIGWTEYSLFFLFRILLFRYELSKSKDNLDILDSAITSSFIHFYDFHAAPLRSLSSAAWPHHRSLSPTSSIFLSDDAPFAACSVAVALGKCRSVPLPFFLMFPTFQGLPYYTTQILQRSNCSASGCKNCVITGYVFVYAVYDSSCISEISIYFKI